jgi:hypothetical protein
MPDEETLPEEGKKVKNRKRKWDVAWTAKSKRTAAQSPQKHEN